ncbi:hypothetical protein RBSWK_05950 [Rhodopirellula baltica SWK14]|uniref:Uncharacterized protein n=2 Tax=Rhodopirellula baltica TaxID=265606 RepID=L7CAI4_RHOBT|nr:hypothetical protein RBSWK_05950 [Rhodopirellula baltica SWK14]
MLFVGCFNLEPQPLTDQRIAIISNTRIQSASVTYPDGTEHTFAPDDYEQFRTLLRTLAPIETVSDDSGLPAAPDYRLMLFAAGNIANIDVHVDDTDQLIYTLDGFQYCGGQAGRFVTTADAARVQHSLDPIDGEPSDAPESR